MNNLKINVNMPKTFFASKPEDLMSGAGPVRACPFYQVPSSPGSTTPTESEYSYPAFIIDTFGDDMVLLKFEHRHVGEQQQIFYPRELHLSECMCRACKGDHLAIYANTSY